jgi:hypothetical protein
VTAHTVWQAPRCSNASFGVSLAQRLQEEQHTAAAAAAHSSTACTTAQQEFAAGGSSTQVRRQGSSGLLLLPRRPDAVVLECWHPTTMGPRQVGVSQPFYVSLAEDCLLGAGDECRRQPCTVRACACVIAHTPTRAPCMAGACSQTESSIVCCCGDTCGGSAVCM